MKKKMSLNQMLPEYAEKHRQALDRQRAEEEEALGAGPVISEEGNAGDGSDIEPGMMEDEQHPVAMVEGDGALASGDTVLNHMEIDEQLEVENWPGVTDQDGSTIIRNGNILRNSRAEKGTSCWNFELPLF